VENDRFKETSLLQLSRLVEVQLVAALKLFGIEYPEKMYDSGDHGLVSESPDIRPERSTRVHDYQPI
jgi:hypothetical protein